MLTLRMSCDFLFSIVDDSLRDVFGDTPAQSSTLEERAHIRTRTDTHTHAEKD